MGGRRPGRYIEYVLLALAYGCTGIAGSVLLRNVDSHLWSIAPRLAIPWLPAGVAIAGLILGGRRLWPAIFLAAATVWIGVVGLPWLTGLFDAAAITIAYVLTVRLLAGWGFRRHFDRCEDPLLLLAAAAIGMLLVEAADLVSVPLTAWLSPRSMTADMWTLVQLTATGIPVPSRMLVETALRWWLNETAGIALVVPALVSGTPERWRALWPRRVELGIWTALSAVWALGMLRLPFADARTPAMMAGLGLVTWGAVRLGVTAASIATLFFSIVASVGFLWQLGPLASMDPADGIVVLWGFISILAASGLFLAALLADRDRVDAELRQSEERLRQAIRVSQIGIYDHDQLNNRIYWSPEQRRTYGFSADEPITLEGFLARVHPDDRATISAAVARAHDPSGDGLFDVEHRIVRRDGDVRWLVTRSQTFFAGDGNSRRPVRTVGAVLDFTERKRAEEALRASEAGLAEAQRLGSMGSWDYDWVAKRLAFSNEAVRIFEFDPATNGPPHPGFTAIAHPEDRELLRRTVRRILEKHPSSSELTYRLLMPDGRVKYVTERWETRFGPDGSPQRSLGTVQDITERQRLESAAIEAAALERRRLASELHDNLGQILFSTSLMLGALTKEAIAANADVGPAVQQINESLNEALDVCRHLAHTAVPVVDGGLGAALANLAARSSTEGIVCVARSSETAVRAVSPSQALQLYRIAQEAITNALKHGRCRRIEVRLRLRGSTVELAIRDDGVGLGHLGHAVDEGLGLRTMRYRAERAGGTVSVGNWRGGGALVRAMVPRLSDEERAESAAEPAA